jgi:hypothetical protein
MHNLQAFHFLNYITHTKCELVKQPLKEMFSTAGIFNPLTPLLNPTAQRSLPRFLTGDFKF